MERKRRPAGQGGLRGPIFSHQPPPAWHAKQHAVEAHGYSILCHWHPCTAGTHPVRRQWRTHVRQKRGGGTRAATQHTPPLPQPWLRGQGESTAAAPHFAAWQWGGGQLTVFGHRPFGKLIARTQRARHLRTIAAMSCDGSRHMPLPCGGACSSPLLWLAVPPPLPASGWAPGTADVPEAGLACWLEADAEGL